MRRWQKNLLLGALSLIAEAQEAASADEGAAVTSETAAVNSTTTTANAAAVVGVSANAAGYFDAFLWALGLNSLIVIGCAFAFSVLRRKFPLVYASNVGPDDRERTDSLFGWMRASSAMGTEERARRIGLDNALLIEFCTLCMRILSIAALPLVLFLVPLHLFGEGSDELDRLSKIELGHVRRDHPWIYYVHAAVVWAVCLVTHREVYRAQGAFLKRRFEWLKHLSFPRSATVLVEAIPSEYRSDAKMREFFSNALEPGCVKEAHAVRQAEDLRAFFTRRAAAQKSLLAAEQKLAKTGDRPTALRPSLDVTHVKVDAIDYHTEEIAELDGKIKTERDRVEESAREPGGVNGHSAFVTFGKRRQAEMVLNARFSANKFEWRMSMPPEPSDIRWEDFNHKHPEADVLMKAVGYLCIAGLFVAFMPVCIFITNIAKIAGKWAPGPLEPIWMAFAPTVGLLIFMSFLPTVLLIIFRRFFILKADAWAQKRLQVWYFWFQVLYVILVTTVGGSLFERAQDLAENPASVSELLAETLPNASHFYMNYLVLQWTTHATNMFRKMNLIKFLLFKRKHSEEEAHALAEPEDQNYMGLGSRSARFTINMLIGVIFSTISPLVAVLALVNFALCRVFYGYLIVFAETKKPDLGGPFWVSQLQHVQIGVIIYSVLMIGILQLRAGNEYPMIIAIPSFFFALWSYLNLGKTFEWEKLPLNDIIYDQDILANRECTSGIANMSVPNTTEQSSYPPPCSPYVQPELQEEKQWSTTVGDAEQGEKTQSAAPAETFENDHGEGGGDDAAQSLYPARCRPHIQPELQEEKPLKTTAGDAEQGEKAQSAAPAETCENDHAQDGRDRSDASLAFDTPLPPKESVVSAPVPPDRLDPPQSPRSTKRGTKVPSTAAQSLHPPPSGPCVQPDAEQGEKTQSAAPAETLENDRGEEDGNDGSSAPLAVDPPVPPKDGVVSAPVPPDRPDPPQSPRSQPPGGAAPRRAKRGNKIPLTSTASIEA